MRTDVLRVPACLAAALAAGTAFPCLLGAQQAPELNEIVVTATRIESPILETPSFVTVITQQQIARSGAADLSAVLSAQSDVVINDNGPQGQVKTASIRGSSSDQVLVLRDGMRLNSSRDGSVDLSQIPLDSIERVEIVRGSGSTMYGTGAIGGVINIITRQPRGSSIDVSLTNGGYLPRRATAVTSTGSTPAAASAASLVDHQNLRLSMTGALGDVGLIGGGSLSRGANAFVWDDPAVLGGWRQRTNAQNLAADAFAGLQTSVLGGSMSVRGTVGYSDVGAPGTVRYPSDDTQQDTTASVALSWTADRFLSDALTLDVKSFYRYEELSFQDPYYPGDHHAHSASLDVTQRYTVSDALSAVYGGSAWYDYAQSSNFSRTHERLNLAGFLSVPFLPSAALTVTPSVRYDWFSDFEGAVSAQLGGVLALSESSSLKASVGSAYRAPTLNELYWYDPSEVGNPSLKPETSYSAEIGYSLSTPRLSVDASAFTRLVLDQIDWDFTVSPGTPVNISEALLPGAEVHARVGVADHVSLEARYTFIYGLLLRYQGQDYTLRDDQRVPHVPLHDARVSAAYDDGTTSASVDAQYVSRTYSDPANTSAWSLAGYLLVNAGVRHALSKTLSVSLALLNVLNETYYTVAGYNSAGSPVDPGYPMPPFSLEAGVQLHL